MTYDADPVNDSDMIAGDRLSEFDDALRTSSRFVRLLYELRDESSDTRGWKARAAKLLGMDPGFVSKLVSGERTNVGFKSVEEAMQRLRLRREYFFGDEEPTSYRDYQGSQHPALKRFLRTTLGQTVDKDELVLLESCDFGDRSAGVTASTYHAILSAVRNFGPKDATKSVRNRTTGETLDIEMSRARKMPRKGD
jgi:hypothetical protein